jgi:hypothetical protein
VAFVVIGHTEGRLEHDLVVRVAEAAVVTKDAAGKATPVSKTRAIGSRRRHQVLPQFEGTG